MNYHVFYIVLLVFLVGAVGGFLVERSAQEKLRKQKYEKYKSELNQPFSMDIRLKKDYVLAISENAMS